MLGMNGIQTFEDIKPFTLYSTLKLHIKISANPHIYMYVFMYVCVYICMYVCMYVYTVDP